MLIIPAKYGSTRLPRKNFIPFFRQLSLFQICCIRADALDISPIVISSENIDLCKSQLSCLRVDHSNFTFRQRPRTLSRDPATIFDVVLDSIISLRLRVEEKAAVILPTSPFNSVSLIQEAYNIFDATRYSRLLSVSQASKPPFNAWQLDSSSLCLSPLFPDSPFKLAKSTQCPAAFFSNGCLSIYSREYIDMKQKSKKPVLALKMPNECSIDIDLNFEFKLAQASFADLSNSHEMRLILKHTEL